MRRVIEPSVGGGRVYLCRLLFGRCNILGITGRTACGADLVYGGSCRRKKKTDAVSAEDIMRRLRSALELLVLTTRNPSAEMACSCGVVFAAPDGH
jgi:hypothetical protein